MVNIASQRGIGWAIRTVRKAQKRTLEDLATAIGSDATNLSRIERGLQQPTERMMVLVGSALNVKVSELWRLAESSSRDADTSGRVLALSGLLSPRALDRLLDYGGYLLEHDRRD